MTAIRIIIMRETKTHILSVEKEGGRYRKGEAVDVYLDRGGARRKNGHPDFDTIYVPDFSGTLQEAKDVLLAQHHIDDDETKGLFARRVRVLDQLTAAQASDLNDNGHITISLSELNTRTRTRATNTR